MQRGIIIEQSAADGWLNRHLALQAGQDPVFHAVGLVNALPLSLAGSYPAISMRTIEDFGLNAGDIIEPVLEKAFSSIYQQESLLDVEAAKALSAMAELRLADPGQFEAQNGAIYPDTEFGQRFRPLGQ